MFRKKLKSMGNLIDKIMFLERHFGAKRRVSRKRSKRKSRRKSRKSLRKKKLHPRMEIQAKKMKFIYAHRESFGIYTGMPKGKRLSILRIYLKKDMDDLYRKAGM